MSDYDPLTLNPFRKREFQEKPTQKDELKPFVVERLKDLASQTTDLSVALRATELLATITGQLS